MQWEIKASKTFTQCNIYPFNKFASINHAITSHEIWQENMWWTQKKLKLQVDFSPLKQRGPLGPPDFFLKFYYLTLILTNDIKCKEIHSEKIRVPDGIWTHDPPWSSRML